MREGVYKAYFEMQRRKIEYETIRSRMRKEGDNESASEYGERASVVGECMSILAREFKLKFE